MNPKTLQYIMGHSDISVTLNVYTHVQFDDAQAELLRVAEALNPVGTERKITNGFTNIAGKSMRKYGKI